MEIRSSSLSETVGRINWDVFTRVERENIMWSQDDTASSSDSRSVLTGAQKTSKAGYEKKQI
jgi:hypothetical protein